MPVLAEILERFRHAVAPPGAPAPATAVPRDEAAARELEVAGLVSSLAAVEAEIAAVDHAAQQEAERIRTTAAAEAEEIRSRGVERATVVRQEALAERRRAVTDIDAEMEARIADEVEGLRRRTEAWLPSGLTAVLACVRAAGNTTSVAP
jgi:hypothetical protein